VVITMHAPTQAPPVQLVLRAYPPAPARVGLTYQPFPARLLKSVASLVVFWTLAPWSVALPPYYPWPILCLCTGAYLAHLFWHGRYRVRWFVGVCPRCGGQVRLSMGERIDLPHTLTCFACHFEPVLEVADARDVPAPDPLPHVRADCTGRWTEEWMWDDRFLACDGCGARQPATPELRRRAEEENEHGALLRQLADEGRWMS
jgi:hypothetical protein